jgi:hypothetical protein
LLAKSDPRRRYVLAPGFDRADLVKPDVRSAGFAILSRNDHFIDDPDEKSTRWMIVFRKPPF